MKLVKMFLGIALLAIVLAGLAGCASQKLEQVGKPITVGDKTYTGIILERVNPFGTNGLSLHLVESDTPQSPQQPQQQMMVMGPSGQMMYAAQPPQQQMVMGPSGQMVCIVAQQPRPVPTNTHLVNSNNQGSIGWANNAFAGSVGDAILAGGIVGGAALIRPAHISGGGGASASSSSAAAASGP